MKYLKKKGVSIIPWLVGTEHKKVAKIDCKYMFGHFELPFFKMNAMVEMPDHGGITASMLDKPEYVLQGISIKDNTITTYIT